MLPSRFAIVPPPGQPLNVSGSDRDLALSPDGRHLVYRAGGTEHRRQPVDGARDRSTRRAAARGRRLRTTRRSFPPTASGSGSSRTRSSRRCRSPAARPSRSARSAAEPLGASWGDDNTIVFATDDPSTGLWRVSADGGEPTVLTTPDAAQREGDHAFPSVLPGGRGVLFTIAAAGQADNAQVAVLDLTTGQRKTLVERQPGRVRRPVGGSGQAGYLIYAAAGTLRAVRFDPVRLEVLGDPVTVVEHVMMKPTGAANYAVSRQGTLVYMPGGAGEQTTPRSLVWVDRKGHEEPIRAPLRAYGTPRLSPDGTRVAVEIYDQEH